MSKHNRNTLKSFFSDGAMPSSDMFEDLIDSTINLNDDGFEKTAADGIKITNIGDYKILSSYYNQSDRDHALWQMRFDGANNNFVLGKPEFSTGPVVRDGDNESSGDVVGLEHALCISESEQALKVGIGQKAPKDTLDVNGSLRSIGRRGSFGDSFQTVPADRNWHDVTPLLKGGVVLEVVARAKNVDKKYYGLMHAIALHSPWRARRDLFYLLGLKNKIRYTHGFYDSMLHKLKLRWRRKAGEDGYRLQIRSNCRYGNAGVLDYHITCLWSDEDEFKPIVKNEEV